MNIKLTKLNDIVYYDHPTELRSPQLISQMRDLEYSTNKVIRLCYGGNVGIHKTFIEKNIMEPITHIIDYSSLITQITPNEHIVKEWKEMK